MANGNGRVIKGKFGNLNAVDAPSDSPTTSANPASATGTPVTAGDIQQQLSVIAHNAQVAAARLIQLPPVGAIAADALAALLNSYVQIQGNIADIASRADTDAAIKDVSDLQQQVQDFIAAVENAIAAVKPAPGTVPIVAPVAKKVPWLLIGGGALGLLAIGVGVYQFRKSTARAARASAARGSMFAGTATKKRKRRRGKRTVEE
jgi:hypothetical protein